MNRRILIFLIVFLLNLFPSTTYGQGGDKNIFDKIKHFGKTLQEKNTLDSILKKTKKIYSTPDEVNILKSIRSPFEPRTPKEKIVTIAPKPAPKPEIKHVPKKQEITVPEVPLPTFKVNGVVWDTKRPQAILDSQVINIGDTIKGCTVINIDKNGILLNFQDRTFTVQP
jgi:hypothetical protein